jgi:hypothetical protein
MIFFVMSHKREQLAEIVTALQILARYGLLYGGFRRRQRRVADVRLTSCIVVKYEDGDTRYLCPKSNKTHRFYVYIPPLQE